MTSLQYRGSLAAPRLRSFDVRTLPLLALALAGAALVSWHLRSDVMDDAYIGFRYLDNLLNGEGFVFNPGERVEGVSNIGWLLILAPFAKLLGLPLAAKILGGGAIAAAVMLAGAASERIEGGERTALPILIGLVLLAQLELTYFTAAGMETGALAVLLLAIFLLSFDDRHPTLVVGLCALAFLVRPECVLVLPLAAAILAATRTLHRAELLRRVGLYLILVGIATLARFLYFGDVVPNTFHAKGTHLAEGIVALLIAPERAAINFTLPFSNVLVLGVVAFGLKEAWRRSPQAAAFAAAVIATGYLFALSAEPDWTRLGRYFAPYAPLGIVILASGAMGLERRLAGSSSRRTGWATAAGAAALVAVGLVNGLVQSSPVSLQTFPGYVMATSGLVDPARWLKENLPESAVIATRRIGVAAFVGERRVLDYSLGLTDRDVADLVARTGSRIWSPNDPRIADLWRQRRPDYLLEDSDVLGRIIAESGGSADSFAVHGLAYRVVKRFPVGRRVVDGLFGPESVAIDWVLAERVADAGYSQVPTLQAGPAS